MYDQLSGHAIFRHDDCLKLNIRSSYTGSLTDELERLFVPSGASSSGVGSRNPQVSVWADFSTNGVDSELDEIDQLGIRVRRGDSAAASGGESMSDSCSTASSSPELETGGFPLVGGPQQQHGVGSGLAAPMSRTRLLEILRMSERGRLKSKAAAQKAAAAKLAQPTSNPTQVCVFCRNNGENEMVYSSHTLKDAYGKTACPVLYIYTCPICRANGPEAHTIKYCPQNNHSGVQAATVAIAPQPQAPKPTRATFSRHQRRQQRYQQQQQKQLQQMQSFTSSNWGN